MAQICFTNARVLAAGKDELQGPSDITVDGNVITAVTPTERTTHSSTAGVRTIDVGRRTLMPGLIDAHSHVTGLSLSPRNRVYPESEITFAAASYLQNSLMDGFTTIREAGGADYTIAHLLAAGKIVGPRLFYSGRALTQTGGGADFRTPAESADPTGHAGPFSIMSVITDGVAEVRRAAREELRKGATQLKAFVSGGVVFPSEGHPTRYEFSLDELRAIVEEAAARGTYVMAHVYTDEGVRRCLETGVRSLEHANFASEETIALAAERGAFLDPTFISLVQRIETASTSGLSTAIVANLERTVARGRQVYQWAERHRLPIALGTDLWGIDAQRLQVREFSLRAEFDDPVNVIHSATVVNADLLMHKDRLGVIAAGAFADLLVVEGNPLHDLGVLTNPAQNLKLIMKDGVIYKNEL
jgi:imidazolonepropionase-like amidohydrolase